MEKIYYLYIKADTNDGDYISNLEKVSNETLEIIKPVIEAIKNFKPYEGVEANYMPENYWIHNHNYPNSEFTRADLGEKKVWELYGHLKGFNTFNSLVPYGEYGIHTIVEVKILEFSNELKLI